MTKLCPRGKAAAKRKFKVYPSAYANAYASKICAGKIKDPSGTKRKDWGPKKKIGGIIKAKDGYHNDQPIKQKKKDYLKKMPEGQYNGSYIKGNLDGQEVSNKSYVNYYKGMVDV